MTRRSLRGRRRQSRRQPIIGGALVLGTLAACVGVAALFGHRDEMAALTTPMPPPPAVQSAPAEAASAAGDPSAAAAEKATPRDESHGHLVPERQPDGTVVMKLVAEDSGASQQARQKNSANPTGRASVKAARVPDSGSAPVAAKP
jgi:hypothetical protein